MSFVNYYLFITINHLGFNYENWCIYLLVWREYREDGGL
jgi:hypothetical protein